MLIRAEEVGLSGNTNPFYIDDESYQRLKPHLKEKKDMNKDARKGYQTGPEFDDLRIFLQVCRETGIQPMLVLAPVNGYYYDYTGFPVEAREAYYQKIRDIAEEYGVLLADFSDQEYTKYFFEDRVHLGKKGWVMVNEAIEQFARS
jgi:D-alanine transfer protein